MNRDVGSIRKGRADEVAGFASRTVSYLRRADPLGAAMALSHERKTLTLMCDEGMTLERSKQ